MKVYQFGKIVYKAKNYIILETNFTGYMIYVSNVERFVENKNSKVFIYEHKNEYGESMYGFTSFKEKILFEDLISLNGIGPKTAIEMLNKDWKTIAKAISDGNSSYLSEFKYIGNKLSRQIIFEFQEKYTKLLEGVNVEVNISSKQEIIDTLKLLGFKTKEINSVINLIKEQNDTEAMVEEAIEIITQRPQLYAENN